MPKRKTLAQFIKQVKRVHGNIFTFDRTIYVSDATKVIVTCKKHGDFTPRPTNILRGSGCPTCALEQSSINKRKPLRIFIKQAHSVHNHKYDYSLVMYKNNSTPITIVCPKHGKFQQRPNVHIDQRCGCPKCLSSHGEETIRIWLTKRGIPFIPQYMFDECKDKRRLKFDFYLPSHNVVIEYNGLQHYRNVPLLKYSNSSFRDIQRKDKIKKRYAKKKGLHLIIVPYNKKPEDVLRQHFTEALLEYSS